MPISGVVITCRPECDAAIATDLNRYEGVEIHGLGETPGKLVAVVEADDIETEVAMVRRMMAVEGVMDVRIAYHNFEDLTEQ